MNLPPIDPAILAQFNIKPEDRLETVDFGLCIPTKQKQKPLTSDECIKLFGAREAVLMNFVPQMLTALAFEQAEGFINYCRDHRLSEYKKHNREMRKCIDEYNFELRKSYGRAYSAYEAYYQRLHDKVEVDLFKIWCTFTNEAARQFLRYEHKDIPARLTLVKMLLTFVEEFDCQMDKLIESKTKLPCERKRDPYPYLVSVLCLDLVERFNCKMDITEQMALCVRVLANKTHIVVDEIMRDEDAEEAALNAKRQ